ncbi:myrosinase-binding protein 2-like [Brassica rapa]|uniref:BnaCnng52420D protein n=2 Tax=Brassica napus TaxID=3708 RepID=A0A078JM41_BRANA|nr:myrosinase-binding protein 2-like [Brassica napus]XP_013701429.1 myrosinase-binding protein 2-like [Brassica napus]XP_033130903.1 myrosinase-binding protein 2-like [Brassica rapa]XP_033130904.1 myrosinase-binding protein 2-like [Brassica rapa]KAH0920222.1 hypothetical protein HID58_027882 [Brassica napus]KAH0920225.1 hypothetical protein HID58_027885 [Brassica napus]CAF2202488.1 unnamed protein product [Brassica napus]CAF2202542.1 unnamed protein product [Brassica napus]CDY66811.1 BnaCnn
MAQQRMGPSGFQLAGDNSFDDGALDFDGVKNVSIGVREKQIVYISLTYSRGENKETITHGEQPNENMEITFGKGEGYCKTVGGIYKRGTPQLPTGYISNLYFVTSKGQKTESYVRAAADESDEAFSFTADGETQLVGLFGRFGQKGLITIGALFAPE